MLESLRAGGVCAAALVFSAGCAMLGRGGPPPPIEVTVQAADRVNPDEQGQSLPTLVRLYQLKAAAPLESADYGAVYGSDKETLGANLLQADEVVVSPGGTVTKRLVRVPEATALAAVAVVRRPAAGAWRSIVELPSGGKQTRVTFVVEDYRIARK